MFLAFFIIKKKLDKQFVVAISPKDKWDFFFFKLNVLMRCVYIYIVYLDIAHFS